MRLLLPTAFAALIVAACAPLPPHEAAESEGQPKLAVERVESPNFDARRPNLVVIHHTTNTTLDTALEALSVLEAGSPQAAYDSEAARLFGQARAQLEFREKSQLIKDLPERMTALQSTCGRADAAITRRFFEGAVAPEWHEGAL